MFHFFLLAGRPKPSVQWFWSGLPLSSTSEVSSGSTVTSNVILRDLKRSDNGVLLTCQAKNNNVSAPVNYSVALKMNCEYYFWNNFSIILGGLSIRPKRKNKKGFLWLGISEVNIFSMHFNICLERTSLPK